MNTILPISLLLILAICFKQISTQKYTPEEITKLNEFRALSAEMLVKTNAHFMKSDGYLIRYLQARGMNVADANEMLKKAIDWRVKNNIDKILDEEFPQEYLRHPFYQIGSDKDKEGRPVALWEAKKFNTRKYAVGGQSKQLSRILSHVFENTEFVIQKLGNFTGNTSNQAISIIDIQDYSLRQHACLACVPIYAEIVEIFENYYPGLYNKVILVNAPRIFTPLFELLKPLLSPATKSALTTYGPNKSEWQQKLLELIDPSQLPLRLGGTKA